MVLKLIQTFYCGCPYEEKIYSLLKHFEILVCKTPIEERVKQFFLRVIYFRLSFEYHNSDYIFKCVHQSYCGAQKDHLHIHQ